MKMRKYKTCLNSVLYFVSNSHPNMNFIHINRSMSYERKILLIKNKIIDHFYNLSFLHFVSGIAESVLYMIVVGFVCFFLHLIFFTLL